MRSRVELRRGDNRSFSPDEASTFLDRFVVFMSFCSANLGCLLGYVAFDEEGELVACSWHSPQSYALESRLKWCSGAISSDQLERLLCAIVELPDGAEWDRLYRAIRMYLSAHRIELDSRLVLGAASIELLGNELGGAKGLEASCRALLERMNYEADVPAVLSSLIELQRSEKMKDLPATINWLRNRCIHPPREGRPVPSNDQKIEGWRATMDIAALGILHCLGYQGEYISQIRTDSWRAQDIVVAPWVRVTE